MVKKDFKPKNIIVKIFRFDPKKDAPPHFDEFTVPLSFGMSVTNVLDYIYENIDCSIAYFTNCRRGICGRCGLKVNGRIVLACTEIVTDDLILEPLDSKNMVRDLITTLT